MKRRRRLALTSLVVLAFLVGISARLAWRAARQTKLDHALSAAVKKNDASAVVSLLNRGADANTRNIDANEADSLWHRVLEWLHGRRTRRSDGQTVLSLALDWPTFIDFEWQRQETLQEALSKRAAVVNALLDHGADANAACQVSRPTRYRFGNVSWTIESETPLITTLTTFPWVYHLSQGGIRLPSERETEKRYSERLMRLLLDHGAQVNGTDKAGITPLMIASLLTEDGAVKLLLNKGAEVNTGSKDGMTPLAVAISTYTAGGFSPQYNSSLAIIRLLTSHGARANLHGPSENAALVHAAAAGRKDIVEELLAEGVKTSRPH